MCKALETHSPAPQKQNSLGVRVHSYNPSAWEVDAKVSRVQGYPQLQKGFEVCLSNMRAYFNKNKKINVMLKCIQTAGCGGAAF